MREKTFRVTLVRLGELRRAAYYLALIGGILLCFEPFGGVLSLILRLVGHVVPIAVPFRGVSFGFDFLPLILGVVAIILAKRAGDLVWSIVLIVVGYLGGGIGGILVLLGGLVGLICRFI